ncbi:MAG: FAD-binding protein [Deltaproteobacteria bacterium]|nr:FAD-binding protein [Deltaproteobacteria bacterium]
MVLFLAACTSPPDSGPLGGDSARDSSGRDSAWETGLDSAGDSADSAGDSAADSGADTGGLPDPIAEADVVVIGAGGSGLATGVAAMQAGASVIILEREANHGGASVHAGNFFACGTHWQADGGVTDSAELCLSEWDDFTGGDATAAAVQDFVNESAATLEWLAAFGGDFTLATQVAPETGTVPRIHLPAEGLELPVNLLGEYAMDNIRTSATATGLVREDGRVIGVDIGPGSDGGGQTGWIRAGAVVVATGGFGRNDVRVAENVPGIDNFPTFYEATPGMDGNGLDLVEAMGGALANMDDVGLYAHAAADAQLGAPEVMVISNLDRTLVVDATGKRVADEREFMTSIMGSRYIDEGPYYAIYDDTGWGVLQLSGRGFNYPDGVDMVLDGPTYESLVPVPVGDTAADLATAAGFDSPTFEAALSLYNEAAASGVDTEFGKPEDYLQRIRTGPFRAIGIVLGRSKSFGGAALDDEGRVIDEFGNTIPGLYAAGEAAGFLGGTWIGHGFNGTITAVYWSGRRAGSTAAADLGY